MQINKIIGLDIDDTLYPFFETVIPLLNKYTDKKLKISNIDSFHILPLWNITSEEFRYLIKINNIYGIGKIEKEVLNLIKDLENNNHKIIFVTSRFTYNDYDTIKNTKEWLKSHNLDHIDVIFTNDKGYICKEHNINIFVDDGLHNILHIQEHSSLTKCIIIDKPWNGKKEFLKLEVESKFSQISRIKKLTELKKHI